MRCAARGSPSPAQQQSQPASEEFLLSSVSQGVSKRGLACVPVISKDHFDPGAESEGAPLLQKALCGSAQPGLSLGSLQRSTPQPLGASLTSAQERTHTLS